MHYYLGTSEEDIVRILEQKDNLSFKYQPESTPVDLSNLISRFLNHQLEPYYKSERVPQKNRGLIKKVVGDSFDEMVIHNQHNVLLFVYDN